jgi:hypothetical protein
MDPSADPLLDLSPEEITQQLQLTKLKDKLWYVAPSVATDGTGIFEGLVSRVPNLSTWEVCHLTLTSSC